MPGQASQADGSPQRQAEAVSSPSELLLRRALEKLPVGAYTCDAEGLLTYFNPQAVQLWGRTPKLNDPADRFCGSFKLFAPDGTPIAHDQCWMAQALRQDQDYNRQEIVIERPDGQRRTLLAHVNPMHEEAGQLVGAVNVLVDITERQRAEETLRQSEERLRLVAQATLDAHYDWNIPANTVWRNDGYQRLYGESEPVGDDSNWWLRNMHPDDRDAVMASIRTAFQGRQRTWSGQYRFQRHQGDYAVVLDRGFIEYDATGQPVRFLGAIIDLTERVQAEEALRESEQRLQTLASFVPVGLFRTNARGDCVYVNERWCDMAGMTPAMSKGHGWAAALHPEDRARVLAEWSQAAQTGSEFQSDYRFQTPAGRSTWLHGRAVAFREPDGSITGFLGSITDITERKRAEEERRKLEAQMQHAQKLESLGVLAGGIAHDFNNLLTSMLGFASLALMKLPEESAVCPMLREIEKAARRAADLTQQMLAYSGRGKFVIEVLHLDRLVQEMTELLGTVVSKKAALKLQLEPAVVEGDPTQIRQIVMNLITNASDALEEQVGAVNVRTGVRQADAAYLRSPFFPDELPAGAYAFVEVEDTGCGMSAATLAKIFDPFFTTKFTGRGLGLAAVLGIVRGHHGTLKVDSTPGQGTRFEVLLPCHAGTATEGSVPGSTAALARGQGLVLIVDDEAGVRGLARHVLESAGFEVCEARDGREGLDVFGQRRREIVAVLLDLTMPRMDGVEALATLRQLDPEVPVLVMSGFSEVEVALRFAGRGASGFIQKPFPPGNLVARLCQFLPTQPSGR